MLSSHQALLMAMKRIKKSKPEMKTTLTLISHSNFCAHPNHMYHHYVKNYSTALCRYSICNKIASFG